MFKAKIQLTSPRRARKDDNVLAPRESVDHLKAVSSQPEDLT
jgi:hypothetical protein